MVCGSAFAIPANPEPFLEAQGDGTLVVLRARGDEHFSWLEDEDGYTVVRHRGWLHYAEKGADGRLKAGPHRVGFDDPRALGLSKRLLPSAAVRAQSVRTQSSDSAVGMEAVQTTGALKNLVVMIRFSDHVSRVMPPLADYETLFNDDGADSTVSPYGSLKELYKEISYNQLTIDSTLSNWITVSNTEAYYANNQGGDSTLWQALNQSLDILDASIDFGDYDEDNDGYVDSIGFIHSGYGAEWGGVLTRIWSHKWAIQNPAGGWVSDDQNANGQNVRVFNYHISTGLWGTSGTNIGRVGVIAHETGHYLGLPDLYDTDSTAGEGIGSWGLMANSWGFDFEQYCPGHMSAWSKMQLGWVAPTVLSGAGQYFIDQAETSAQAYRINSGYPSGEYLLIENRQPLGVDCSMPQGGLLIWHIDDTTGYNTQGYPGQGSWPANGNHYRVALLQADGNYDLEKGNNRGDAGDTHHGAGVDAIGPGPSGHPNTDAYKNGIIIQTGNTISNISNAGASMSFCYNSCTVLQAPSNLAANATGSSSIALSWTDNSSTEGGFRLEHSTDGSSWSLEANLAANATTYNDTSLAAGSTHWYRVRAFAGADVSSWSNTASATTDQLPPAAPSGLSANGVSQSQIDLAWTDNSGNETGFRVEVSTNGGGSFTTLANRPAGTTSHSHTGLASNLTRHYRVWAVNGAGENVSNIASGTTLPPPPLVEYVAYAETHTSGTVSGSYPATHADDGSEQQITEQQSGGKPSNRTSYLEHAWRFNIGPGDTVTVNAQARRSNNSEGDNIQFAWSSNGVNYTNLFAVNSATEGSYQGTIPNTVSGEVYIRAIDTNRTAGNSAADSLWVDHLAIVVLNEGPPIAPNAPSNLGASAGGQTSINLAWTDNANNEGGFRVERSANGINDWAQVASLGANVTSWANTGLTQNSTWFYRVLAFNGVGDSGWSNVASATTDIEQPPPAAPDNLQASATGSSSIALSWQDNANNETGFHLQRSTNGVDFSTIATLGVNQQAYGDSNLQAETPYWYQVRAFNASGESSWSNIATATTDAGPPPASIVLSVSAYKVKGKKAFDLSWSGATTASVDVYRDGVKVFTTTNDGAHSYNSGLGGGGTHTHRVCELNSTTVCSNIVSSTF